RLPFSSCRGMRGVHRSAKISAPRDTGQNWPYWGTRVVNASGVRAASSFFGLSLTARRDDGSRARNALGRPSMRQLGSLALALSLVTCGGAAPLSASSATPPTTPAASPAPSVAASPVPSYAPAAEGFMSKVLIEKART